MAPAHYISRSLEPVLSQAAAEFPAVVLTGPRQSGKTTLLRRLFGATHGYASLEPPDVRAAASVDPRGFLEMHPPPVIFDEAQYAPDLFPYIKERIDADRDRCGQYLLTGSQNLVLMARITESLAGRAAILRLLPLSRREAEGRPLSRLPWETLEDSGGAHASAKRPRGESSAVREKPASLRAIWDSFLRGSYPELVAKPERDWHLWHAAYVQTYLERDVRGIRQVGDLSQFQSFLRALAARSAQLLNLSDLARDLGIAVNTIRAWLSVLEATYQVTVLRPYANSLNKRLVKMPKVYFTDVGTLCYLAGLRDPEHAASGPMAGAIFETAVLSEILKTLTHRGVDPQLHFWRTSIGAEVDIVVEVEDRMVPVEVKLSSTPHPAMAAPLRTFRKDYADRALAGYVVHPGSVRLPLGDGVTALPFVDL